MPDSRRASAATGPTTRPKEANTSARRACRRGKDQKRVPLSLRVTPQMRDELERVAQLTGRSLAQQTEFLLEHALRWERVMTIAPAP
jgi:hypothetical protein